MIEGELGQDALRIRGVDLTSVDQLTAALGDPSLRDEVASLRVIGKVHWFTARQLSMSVLSAIVLVALLRRWGTASNWLLLLTLGVPGSMILAAIMTPSGGSGEITGMIAGCLMGGLLWLSLWLIFRRRVMRVWQPLPAQGADKWWFNTAAIFVVACLAAVPVLGAVFKSLAEGNHTYLDVAAGSVAPPATRDIALPLGWTIHTGLQADAGQPSVSLGIPDSWEIGEPGLGRSVFVAVPPGLEAGNLVVHVGSVDAEIDVWQETAESFRAGFLQTAIFYAGMEITSFRKALLASGQRCIDIEYTATSIADTRVEGLMRMAACGANLVSFHAEARSIGESIRTDLKRVADTLRVECK